MLRTNFCFPVVGLKAWQLTKGVILKPYHVHPVESPSIAKLDIVAGTNSAEASLLT